MHAGRRDCIISVDTDGVVLLSIADWVTPEVKMK